MPDVNSVNSLKESFGCAVNWTAPVMLCVCFECIRAKTTQEKHYVCSDRKPRQKKHLWQNWYLQLIMQVPPLLIKTFLWFVVVSPHLSAVYVKAGRELLETDVCSGPCWFFRLSREATWSDQISAYTLSLTGHAHTLGSESDDPSAGWAYSKGF